MRFRRTRLTMAMTAVMVVVWAGVAVGTNGDPIRAGQATSATAQTTINTTQASGNGFQVNLSGATTGAALRGNGSSSGVGVFGTAGNANGAAIQGVLNSAIHGTGAAGFFGGGQNNGVNSNTGNANSLGVRARNNASTHGTGSAGLFIGGQNDGVVATTATNEAVAVVAKNPAAPGFGTAATSVFANSASNTGLGVLAVGGMLANGPGSSPSSAYRTGVVGVGAGSPSVGFNDVGVGGSGTNGVTGVGSTGGVGVAGINFAGTAGSFAGDVSIDGNLTITGTCTGCTGASVAANGGATTLQRGDPVAVVGMRLSPVDGRPMLVVAPARPGRAVIGVVDSSLRLARLHIGATLGTGRASRPIAARTFRPLGSSAAPGRYLAVITHGAAWARVDAGSRPVTPGMELVAGGGGALVARGPLRVGQALTPGSSVGFAMQRASGQTGLVAVFVSPH